MVVYGERTPLAFLIFVFCYSCVLGREGGGGGVIYLLLPGDGDVLGQVGFGYSRPYFPYGMMISWDDPFMPGQNMYHQNCQDCFGLYRHK